MYFNPAGTRVVVNYEDGRGELIDLEGGNGRILFERDNIFSHIDYFVTSDTIRLR